MDYQTYEPSAPINSFVKCYWTLDAPKSLSAEKQRIVPDGCMEMIFHHGDLYWQYLKDGSYIVQPQCFVFGQITKMLEIEASGVTGIFSVRFHPGGFIPFASLTTKQMENRAVPLNELFDNGVQELEAKMLNALTTEDRIKIIEAFLIDKLIAPESIDRIIKSSVKTILKLKGKLSVTELSKAVNTNRRQLERRFSSVIGLSPKQLAKIIRLQTAIHAMLSQDFNNLTTLAYEGDYFDQAHFIKDFKEFTGVSPKKFYSDHLKMTSLLLRT